MDIAPRAETLDDKPGVELQFIVCASDGDVYLDGGFSTTFFKEEKYERHEAKPIWMLYGVNVIGFHAMKPIKCIQMPQFLQRNHGRNCCCISLHVSGALGHTGVILLPKKNDTHMAHRGTSWHMAL